MTSYYAVANGYTVGIFYTWKECNESVKGFPKAKYKKFENEEDANVFIHDFQNTEPAKPKNSKLANTLDMSNTIPDYYVYTDGACSNNGKSCALAGFGIFFGIDDSRNISKRVDGKQSNNTAELTAIIETYTIIEEDIRKGMNIAIVSDSEYAIKCASTYGEKCHKKGWAKMDIPNKELVQRAYEIYNDISNIQFIHIRAHTGHNDIHSLGNENADKLANMAIGLENCPYVKSAKIYISVPYVKKEDIKKLGGSWDVNKKKWFIYENSKNKKQILDMFQLCENL